MSKNLIYSNQPPSFEDDLRSAYKHLLLCFPKGKHSWFLFQKSVPFAPVCFSLLQGMVRKLRGLKADYAEAISIPLWYD
jgi:hypothetical protein